MQQSYQHEPQLSIKDIHRVRGGRLTVPLYQGGANTRPSASPRKPSGSAGSTSPPRATRRGRGGAGVGAARGRQGADPGGAGAGQASEVALNGVREEARVGQRTTLDVLNAQQALVNARVALVTAQRDRVVASYALLAAVGAAVAAGARPRMPVYDPMVHYQQVRDAWVGVRTPDGR